MTDLVDVPRWEDPIVQAQFARTYAEMALADHTALVNLTAAVHAFLDQRR